MFQKLKTIFKHKEVPTEKQAGRNGNSVLAKVTGVGKEKSRGPVPLAPTEGSQRVSPSAASQVQPFQPQAPIQHAVKSPEEICGVTSKMNKEEIRARLAFLYRRYNRATSSMNPKLREEADEMLDAVVAVREKVFGSI